MCGAGGANTLTGGAGADHFAFEEGTAYGTAANDALDLSSLLDAYAR